MCDTMVALGNATADGAVLFAKNSDRDPNEAHELVIVPAARHATTSTTRCTYIDVAQVPETFAVLLCKPFWIWGAEMGANEHGVIIGNEAVWTRVPLDDGPGLLGMDLLLLALERAPTAQAAVEVIGGLLAHYGQGGNCGYAHPFFYHNSFLIADPHEAWVLETAGREWAAERVVDVRSISNALTIGTRWDLASPDMVAFAIDQDWATRSDQFDFASAYGDPTFPRLDGARGRQCRSQLMLERQSGNLTPATMMAALRDHEHASGPDELPAGPPVSDICMHGTLGTVHISQTTGSLVSQITPQQQTHWVTGTSAPCTGIFKPVWLDAGLPVAGLNPTGTYDAATLWWHHEALHRAVLRDYPRRLGSYRADRDALESSFIADVAAATDATAAERAELSSRCFAAAADALDRWTAAVLATPPTGTPPADSLAWFEVAAADH